MHASALRFISEIVHAHPAEASGCVLEIGSRIFHDQDKTVGTVRGLFPYAASYVGLDARPGPGVDTVGMAADFCAKCPGAHDALVCAEVLEHDPDWRRTVAAGLRSLREGGLAIFTWASPLREPHEVETACPVEGQPHYAGLEAAEWFEAASPLMSVIGLEVAEEGRDIYAWGYRRDA